jgi:hypothetical protein
VIYVLGFAFSQGPEPSYEQKKIQLLCCVRTFERVAWGYCGMKDPEEDRGNWFSVFCIKIWFQHIVMFVYICVIGYHL